MDGMIYNSLKEAKEATANGVRGAKYYGKTCDCGNNIRRHSNSACIDCERIATRIRNRKKYAECPERRRKNSLNSKKWREENPEKVRLNKQLSKAKRRADQQNNPLPIGWEASKTELRAAFQKEKTRLTQETGIKYHLDHIIPISKGGPEHELNFQLLTDKDNLRKSDKMPDVTFEELAQIPPTPEHRIGLFIL